MNHCALNLEAPLLLLSLSLMTKRVGGSYPRRAEETKEPIGANVNVFLTLKQEEMQAR